MTQKYIINDQNMITKIKVPIKQNIGQNKVTIRQNIGQNKVPIRQNIGQNMVPINWEYKIIWTSA